MGDTSRRRDDGRPRVDWDIVGPVLRSHPYRLYPQELAVLRGIFEGASYRRIGNGIDCTHHTVESYWRRIKPKLDVMTHNEAIHKVYDIRDAIDDAEQRAGAAAPERPKLTAVPYT